MVGAEVWFYSFIFLALVGGDNLQITDVKVCTCVTEWCIEIV
jgi:hypothetical protein